jgi:hypothetical protein
MVPGQTHACEGALPFDMNVLIKVEKGVVKSGTLECEGALRIATDRVKAKQRVGIALTPLAILEP